MILFCDEDKEIFIGVFAVDSTEEKIIKKVSKSIGIDFDKTNSLPEEFEPHVTLDFEVDTIVVQYKDYNEDYAELSERGLAIYIIP